MIKKMLGVFTSVIAALAVVGVAWAGTDDATSTSVTAAGETSTSVSIDDSSSSTDATIASSTDATVASTTGPTVDSSTSTSIDDHDDDSTTSTTIDSTTSTSIDDRDDDDTTTSTTTDSTTSTSFDDSDSRVVPDGVNTYQISGVGAVTIEVVAGRLVLMNVSAPGWEIEEQRVEADRVELELVSGEAEAEFRARINNGEIEVRIEVD